MVGSENDGRGESGGKESGHEERGTLGTGYKAKERPEENMGKYEVERSHRFVEEGWRKRGFQFQIVFLHIK